MNSSEYWEQAQQAEINSAADGPKATTFRQVAELYDRLGLVNEVLNIHQRIQKFDISREEWMPAFIRIFCERNMLNDLAKTLTYQQAITNPSAELRQEIARAYVVLKQTDKAVETWTDLIRQNQMSENSWLCLGQFLALYGAHERIANAFAELGIHRLPDPRYDPIPSYCAAKCFYPSDLPDTYICLSRLATDSIQDADVALDLAILWWQLSEFENACRAVDHSIKLREEWPLARTVRATIRSFHGENTYLNGPPIVVPGHALDMLHTIVSDVPMQSYGWGFFTNGENLRVVIVPWDDGEERAMDIPSEASVPFTFSVLPGHGQADPLTVLPYVDDARPHLMVQRKPEVRIHAFRIQPTKNPGQGWWGWREEKLLSANQCEQAKEDSERSWCHGLWLRAWDELKRRKEGES